jgi:hypothetical protein
MVYKPVLIWGKRNMASVVWLASKHPRHALFGSRLTTRLSLGFFNPPGLTGVMVLIEGHTYPREQCPAPPTRPDTGADMKRTRLLDQQTIIWGTPSLLELTTCGTDL